MPTYDYECDACQHRFEQFQSITAEALRKCPKCGRRKLRRLIGPGAAIVFKGSGFYCTDYRSSSYKKGAAADSGGSSSSSTSASSSNGSSNGKPAEKSKKEKSASS
jgi:putative FmdB family regulatory protein